MKIIRLESENIKGLRAVEIEPDGSLVVVAGKNGAGKTSVLDSIWYALGGKDALPSKPIRNGEKKAHIKLDLGDIVVERSFTEGDSKVKVRSKDGATYQSPQAMLDALCSKLAFDPLELSRLDAKKQAEALRKLVGIDFSQLDAKRKGLYDSRTLVNRQLTAAKAKLASAVKHEDAPASDVSVAELSDELDRRRQHNSGIEAQAEYVDRLQSDIDGMASRIDEINRRIKALTDERDTVASDKAKAAKTLEAEKATYAEMKALDVEEIRQQIRSAGEVNAKVAANRAHAELSSQVSELEAESKSLTEAIDGIDGVKQEQLRSAPFPVPGLGFDNDGITFNGLPFDQASGGERLRVLTAWAMAQHPKLRVMLIRDASLLDEDGLQIIQGMAETEGYQVWLERVTSSSEGCTVFIEDGAVKVDAEMAEAAT